MAQEAPANTSRRQTARKAAPSGGSLRMGVAGYHDFQHSLRRVLTPPARTCRSLFPCFPPCSQVRPQTVPLRRVLSAEAPSALLRSSLAESPELLLCSLWALVQNGSRLARAACCSSSSSSCRLPEFCILTFVSLLCQLQKPPPGSCSLRDSFHSLFHLKASDVLVLPSVPGSHGLLSSDCRMPRAACPTTTGPGW